MYYMLGQRREELEVHLEAVQDAVRTPEGILVPFISTVNFVNDSALERS
jgi:hypothetical protein